MILCWVSFMLSINYAECHCAECRYAECRGTLFSGWNINLCLMSMSRLQMSHFVELIEKIFCRIKFCYKMSLKAHLHLRFGNTFVHLLLIEIRLECRWLQKCFLIWNYDVGCLWAPLLVLTQSKETVFWLN